MPTEAERHQSMGFSQADLADAWAVLSSDERIEGLKLLPRPVAEEFFGKLSTRDQSSILLNLPPAEQKGWMHMLQLDDAADVIQFAGADKREALLGLLDDLTRAEVTALLAYAEDAAGGLMNPRFARVRPEMTVHEAISYLRKQPLEQLRTIQQAYALDAKQKLDGVVTFQQLFTAQHEQKIRDVMHPATVTVQADMDQEKVSRLFAHHDLTAIPVVDAERRMKGVVTIDDIVDVVQEEATEDIHKLGGVQALEMPYLSVALGRMVRKRGVWLAVLFLGEMLTATVVAFFEKELARALVLALFIPLIVSSGGNSGSQASALVIRAMALGEVKLADWWKVMRRELALGLLLGLLLGGIGFLRIVAWQRVGNAYGEHYLLIALTVGTSLVGVVTLGVLAGSMLPFILRRLGFDPASASTPFVATLVDVTGLVIYFGAAATILRGTLL